MLLIALFTYMIVHHVCQHFAVNASTFFLLAMMQMSYAFLSISTLATKTMQKLL